MPKRMPSRQSDWLKKAKEEGTYDLTQLRKKQRSFGTAVLECDLDLPPETVYKAYSRRWEIELVMRYYKHACDFDGTRVQDDYSVIGSEFCDFLSIVPIYRLINRFDGEKQLETYTYRKVMSLLARAKKARVDRKEWQLVRMNPSQLAVLESLWLLPKTGEPPRRKKGRPKGSRNRPKTEQKQKARSLDRV